MATYHTLPPYRSHPAKPISATEAQQLLSTYLELSETQQWLHPDAILNTAGVQFSVEGGSMGGIVLHNLRRVEAGLRGERLEPEVPKEEVVEEETTEEQATAGAAQNGVDGEAEEQAATTDVDMEDAPVEVSEEHEAVAESPEKSKKAKKDKKEKKRKQGEETVQEAQQQSWSFGSEEDASKKRKHNDATKESQEDATSTPQEKELSKEEKKALKKAKKATEKSSQENDASGTPEKKRKKKEKKNKE